MNKQQAKIEKALTFIIETASESGEPEKWLLDRSIEMIAKKKGANHYPMALRMFYEEQARQANEKS